jgi:Zn-finger protein
MSLEESVLSEILRTTTCLHPCHQRGDICASCAVSYCDAYERFKEAGY